jgi:hypothetical protein
MTCNACRDRDHANHNQWAPCDCVGECEQRDTIPDLVIFESDRPEQGTVLVLAFSEAEANFEALNNHPPKTEGRF